MNESASIASPHWEACRWCRFFFEHRGCVMEKVELELYMGDFILCKQFEENQEEV